MVAEPAERDPELAEKVKSDVPHSARIWNYWQGGKDNYPVDREAGDAVVEVFPDIVRPEPVNLFEAPSVGYY